MTNVTKGKIIKGSALFLDFTAPFIATVSQFPIWIDKSSEATISGLFVVLAFICCLPFLSQIINWLKSPSIPVLWLILFVISIVLENIISQMKIVFMVGFLANIIGSTIYKVGSSVESKEESEAKEV